MTVSDLHAAADALGYFGPDWRLICRDSRGNCRSVDDAKRELASFIRKAEARAKVVARQHGAEAIAAALAGIRGHQVLGARVKWGDAVPYLWPMTDSAWRLSELHAFRCANGAA